MTVTTAPEQAIATTPATAENTAKPAAPKAATKAADRKSPLIPKALAKPAVKALAKVAAKPAEKPAKNTAAKPTVKPVAEKPVKLKKPKLVRDSFTIPKAEYTVLDDLKQRATNLSSPVKKSELLRAGIKALAAMSDTAFLAAVKAVPTIKTGRPSKAKSD